MVYTAPTSTFVTRSWHGAIHGHEKPEATQKLIIWMNVEVGGIHIKSFKADFVQDYIKGNFAEVRLYGIQTTVNGKSEWRSLRKLEEPPVDTAVNPEDYRLKMSGGCCMCASHFLLAYRNVFFIQYDFISGISVSLQWNLINQISMVPLLNSLQCMFEVNPHL